MRYMFPQPTHKVSFSQKWSYVAASYGKAQDTYANFHKSEERSDVVLLVGEIEVRRALQDEG
jgi:hypothetical protein